MTFAFSHIFRSVVLLLLVTNVLGQANNEYYKNKNYYSLSLGYMFQLPTLTHNNFNIEREFTHDHVLAFQWYRMLNKHFGTLLKLESLTQTIRYSYTDVSNWKVTQEIFDAGSRRSSLTFALSYNFMAMKRLNLLVSLGPQLHMNKLNDARCTTRSNSSSGDVTSYNIRRLGCGFNMGLNIIYKLTDRLFVFVNPSYQKGFVKFREAIVGDENSSSTLSYYGTGPGILFGIIFRSKTNTSVETIAE